MSSPFKIPTEIFNFTDFHKQSLFYVDKTMLIANTINHTEKFVWYIYPRGFGKTINLNMIYNFFDFNHSFHIKPYYHITSEHSIMTLMNRIPVIYLNFTDTESISQEMFFYNFKKVINRALNYFPFIFSDNNDTYEGKEYFQNLFDLFAEDEEYIYAIRRLIERIGIHHKMKVILIVDGYDELFLKAMQCNYFEVFHAFFSNFLEITINDNPDIIKVIFGGVFPFANKINLKPKIISNTDTYNETTPFYFSQSEATQLVINVTENTSPVRYLQKSIGFYTPDRLIVSPRLLVNTLLNRELDLRKDPFMNLIAARMKQEWRPVLDALLRREKVAISGKLHNVSLDEIACSLEENLLMALVNYGILGVSSETDNRKGLYVFIPNEMTLRAIKDFIVSIEEKNNV